MPLGVEAAELVSWLLALTPALALGLLLALLTTRRAEIRRFEQSHRSRMEAIQRGSHKARLLHPDIDLSACIGCGSCVRACPEDGVLDLLHGQAVVVHGSRCVGHARCADACPTGAIALTFGDLSQRRDLPALTDEFEAVGVPGLYVAGELSGFSLVRTAVSHGATVANAAARSIAQQTHARDEDIDDILIVGLGPAGLSCALRARELGLRFTVIDQAERVGGTVANYPRRKMVMTQPVHLPLFGQLPRLEYLKEELVALWESTIEAHRLPLRTGVRLIDVKRDADGMFTAETSAGPMRARRVCLALGRRGSPRKLEIPGEDLPKVAYSLLDAESYRGRRILVIGGGDSAVEAALGLAEQEGNCVTLSYRSKEFVRLKGRNDTRVRKAMSDRLLNVMFESKPVEIRSDEVVIRHGCGGLEEDRVLPNDEVFIFAGGDPPFAILEKAGVSFDPAQRPEATAAVDQGSTLIWSVGALLGAALVMGGWAIWNSGYYSQADAVRTTMASHQWLRPAGAFGLSLGVLAFSMFVWNLMYLVRRSPGIGRFIPGSLKFWLGSHVFSGLASFGCVLLHAGFTYRLTVGGFAFVALGVVLLAGIVGRYFYALVPHAANGREVSLDELRSRLASFSTAWDRESRGLGETVRSHVDALIDKHRWHASFAGRIREIVLSQFRMRQMVREMRADPAFRDVPEAEREELLILARRAYRLTMQIAHFEELRAVLSSWRYFHRWLALLMVLFVLAHVLTAVRYARLEWPGLSTPSQVLP